MVNAILAFFGMGTLSLAIEGCGAKVCLSPNEKGGVSPGLVAKPKGKRPCNHSLHGGKRFPVCFGKLSWVIMWSLFFFAEMLPLWRTALLSLGCHPFCVAKTC
jgi:hypothetical protein